jgi:peptidoglycan/xylan/chitin deacetylase (PgdA/CDA1 family)
LSLTKKVYLTISGYDIKLSDNLTFYQKDQLKLIFYINEYGIDYENNATTRALMPVNPLNAILFIENPEGVDSVSSAKIEDNAVTFYLDSTHTQYVGVSRMQLRLFDQDGCAITLPHFTFEIRENIYGSGDVRFQNVVMVDQTGTVILTEDNDMLDVGDILTMGTEVAYPQVTKTIKELPIKRNLDGTEKLIVEDNEATKQAPLTTIVDEIKQNSQEKIREIESELAQTNAQLSIVKRNELTKNGFSKRPIVTFIEDDADSDFLTTFKPIYDEYGIKVTIGVICKTIVDGDSTKMTLSQLKDLKKDGFDIVSHSYRHSREHYADGSIKTDELILNDMELSSNWIIENGFNPNVLVFPYGDFSTDKNRYVELSRRFYPYACSAIGNGLNASPVDSNFLSRLNMGAYTIDQIKTVIDRCHSEGSWLIFLVHTYDKTNITEQKMRETLDYIKAKDIEILTFEKAVKLKGNAVSAGFYEDGIYIGNDGNSNIDIPIYLGTQDRTVDTPLTDFPIGIEYKTISAALGASFPDGEPGVLETYRMLNDYYSYQHYKIKWSGKVYARHWTAANKWSDFTLVQGYDESVFNKYTLDVRTPDTPLSAFLDGVEFRTIGVDIKDNFPPSLEGGILETNKNNKNKFFSYQLYHIKNSTEVYKRWWILNPDGSESWGQFTKI